ENSVQDMNFITKNQNDKCHFFIIEYTLLKLSFVLYQKLSKFVLIVNILWLRDNNCKVWKSQK
ncbi:MAG: hypothetical protein ACOVRG_13565, partial [Saprospiraceae bacterium]